MTVRMQSMGAGEVSVVKLYTKRLTNAQILTLPSIPVEIIPAPGVGFANLVIGYMTRTVLPGFVGYGNIDLDGFAYIGDAPNQAFTACYIPNDTTQIPPFTHLTAFLNTNNTQFGAAPTTNFSPDWFTFPEQVALQVENQAMALAVDNIVAGNFTGGAADNFIIVNLLSAIVPMV